MEIQELYQELIIDHGTEPRNCHAMADATHSAKGVNPMCGDRLIVYLKLDNHEIIDVSFDGQGCAISMASASIMTEMLKGKSIDEARDFFTRFTHLVTSDDKVENLGKLEALAGVRTYPSRVKCATLAWHALDAALQNEREATTE